jgi:hypothetical protein
MFNSQVSRIARKTIKIGCHPCTIETSFEAGGLMSYDANLADLSCRAANTYEILNGARPGDLSLVQPTKFVLSKS